MNKLLALAAAAFFALPLLAHADDAPRSDSDCAQLLERWAGDPKAAPKSAINACKDQLAAAPLIAPEAEPVEMADLDPCSGPDAASSVQCWGPWASLAPAAAAPLVALNLPETPVDCDVIAEIAAQCVPQVEPLLTIEGCEPGKSCGFATLVSGFTSTGDPDDTEYGRFDLDPNATEIVVGPTIGGNATEFTVIPANGEPISSVPMTTVVTPRPDGYGNLRATGREDEVGSRLIARVEQDNEGEVLMAADIWSHGTRESPQSGYFAWGTATSQVGLNALNAGNVTLSFTGPMSVNNATTGNMTLKFGSNPTWTGNWTNPNYNFGAGGVVKGPNLISQSSKFTDNVVGSGNFVQGALVGEAGRPRGITHIVDVTLANQGRIKDVGLLREVVPGRVAGP